MVEHPVPFLPDRPAWPTGRNSQHRTKTSSAASFCPPNLTGIGPRGPVDLYGALDELPRARRRASSWLDCWPCSPCDDSETRSLSSRRIAFQSVPYATRSPSLRIRPRIGRNFLHFLSRSWGRERLQAAKNSVAIIFEKRSMSFVSTKQEIMVLSCPRSRTERVRVRGDPVCRLPRTRGVSEHEVPTDRLRRGEVCNGLLAREGHHSARGRRLDSSCGPVGCPVRNVALWPPNHSVEPSSTTISWTGQSWDNALSTAVSIYDPAL